MVCVMVVEDDNVVRFLLVELLKDSGFRVLEAARAHDALLLLQATARVRLIVTDITMPGCLDGIGLAKAARERSPHIPIIFISGEPAKLTEARLLGEPSVFLQKPFALDQLLGNVKRLAEASGERWSGQQHRPAQYQ